MNYTQWIDKIEKQWHIDVKREEKEFLEKFLSNKQDAEWTKQRQLEYLHTQRKKQKRKALWWADFILDRKALWFQELLSEVFLKPALKERDKIEREIGMYNNPKYHGADKITETMIERAREYPIEQIIEVNKNFALCPFHDDHSPSLYCKNNYAHCFSCGETADPIKLFMRIHNTNFKETINLLQ